MKNVIILAAAATLGVAEPALAQSTNNQIIRTPPSTSNGAGSGTSGSVGSPTPSYPGRVRNLNNPSTEFNLRDRAVGAPRR